MYLDAESGERILGRLVNLLSPAGHIYIGHAERLSPDVDDVSFVGLTTYRRVTMDAARPGSGRPGPGSARKEHE